MATTKLAPAASPLPPHSSHKHSLIQKHVWGGTAVIISSVFLVGWLYFCFKRKLCTNCKLRPKQKGKLDAKKLLLRRFQYEELQRATNNFSKDCLVGTGAFGNVFRGEFDLEGILAIKKLHHAACTTIEEFRNEVRLISKVKHQNLVGLVGFCEQAGTKALVYEYVSNGSLLDYIMGRKGMSLTWRQRVRIAIGAAKGIAHLHEGIKPSIIHRDIKPSNILVGENFEAKVSDFGLVKAGPVGDHSHVSSLVKGTPGYLDPAYCASLHLSPFTDVFSFGVILLQLVAARPAVDSSRRGGQANVHIIEWARPSLERGRVEEILDANLIMDMEACNMEVMLKMGQIGLRCVVGEPKMRPTINQVWQELEAALQSADAFLPKQPSLNSQTFLKGSFSLTSYRDHSSSNHIHSQDPISLEFQNFYIDMDSLSFSSANLKCLETDSVSIDTAEELRDITEEGSTSPDEESIFQTDFCGAESAVPSIP